MTSTLFPKYQLLPNYDDRDTVILLGEDGARKIIRVVDGRLAIETVSAKNEKTED
jgi:hypothetical protein